MLSVLVVVCGIDGFVASAVFNPSPRSLAAHLPDLGPDRVHADRRLDGTHQRQVRAASTTATTGWDRCTRIGAWAQSNRLVLAQTTVADKSKLKHRQPPSAVPAGLYRDHGRDGMPEVPCAPNPRPRRGLCAGGQVQPGEGPSAICSLQCRQGSVPPGGTAGVPTDKDQSQAAKEHWPIRSGTPKGLG